MEADKLSTLISLQAAALALEDTNEIEDDSSDSEESSESSFE